MYMCMYVCMCIYVCVCVFMILMGARDMTAAVVKTNQGRLYVCVCMYVYMCLCVCVHDLDGISRLGTCNPHTYVHTYMHAYIHLQSCFTGLKTKSVCMYVCLCQDAHMHTNINGNVAHVFKSLVLQVLIIYKYMHTHAHKYIRTYTYIHTYIHT